MLSLFLLSMEIPAIVLILWNYISFYVNSKRYHLKYWSSFEKVLSCSQIIHRLLLLKRKAIRQQLLYKVMKPGRHWKNMTKYIWLNHVWKISKILNKNEIPQIATFK